MTFVRMDLTVVEILLEMCHDNRVRSISLVFCILLLLWGFFFVVILLLLLFLHALLQPMYSTGDISVFMYHKNL